jgi:adenosylhomocysteine nucleosidase
VILVCAPTRVEAEACRRGLADARASGVEVLRTGVGTQRAAAALKGRLRRGSRPSLVVSSGFAGAVTPGIALHALVTAVALHRLGPDGAVPVPLPPGALRAATGALPCHVATADGVRIGDAPPLAAPAAVDMESAALAEAAAAAGVPFQVLRVVTDTPERPFPPFVRALGTALSTGSPRAWLAAALRAASGAALRPGEAVAFARASLAAARALRAAWRERGGLTTAGAPAPRRAP